MKSLAPLALAIVASLPANSAAGQQTCQPSWIPTFGGAVGVDGSVSELAVFDDGNGPALYAGGFFNAAGGVEATGIAKWDGVNWSQLGSGVNQSVLDLTVFDDGSGAGPALYAGGRFTSAGGLPANYVARWDGSSWSALGHGMYNPIGGNPTVYALTVFDDGSGAGPALYAGGNFFDAGGVVANGIAKWDGSNWSALGGFSGGACYALTVFDDGSGAGPALYAGGTFTSAGGVPANRIAKWNGSSWSALGSGVDQPVSALSVFDDGSGSGPALCAGGRFGNAGGVSVSNIAKWDGTIWSALGSGIGPFGFSDISVLTVFDDGSGGGPALYAGGRFTTAGGNPANRIAKWDGLSWSALGSGVSSTVGALSVFDDGSGSGPALYAGGQFTSTGGVVANRIAKWNGASWKTLGGSGLDPTVDAITVYDDGSGSGPALYAAGDFTNAGGIAKWDGSNWLTLASGMSGGFSFNIVRTVTSFDDGSGPALIAGGNFSSPANNIAKWDGSSWSSLGSGIIGNFAVVHALTIFDDGLGGGPALYVGGDFMNPASRVAKWDGSVWSGLAGGMSSGVRSFAVFDDGSGGGPALYAGGDFTFAGGVSASRIAKWNGSSWSALGSGVNGSVDALTVFDGGSGAGPALYAGGSFTSAGGIDASYIAKWDGSVWSALSGMSGPVRTLGVFDDGTGSGPALYAGGDFTTAGGIAADHIAKWNGSSWSPLGSGGSGMDGSVEALTVFDDGTGGGPALFVGGDFTTSTTGDAYLAKYGCPAPPPFNMFCTAKTATVCGPANISATGTPSATATSGFTIEAQPVRGCRAGLLLYSNQPTVTGAPFGGPGDGVLCLFAMGLRRAGPIESGGTSPQACDGVMSIDMNRFNTNNWAATGCNPPPGQNNPAGFLGNMGTTVNAQMWGRDSIATGQVLSDGISWAVRP